jgi:hypothetical protein
MDCAHANDFWPGRHRHRLSHRHSPEPLVSFGYVFCMFVPARFPWLLFCSSRIKHIPHRSFDPFFSPLHTLAFNQQHQTFCLLHSFNSQAQPRTASQSSLITLTVYNINKTIKMQFTSITAIAALATTIAALSANSSSVSIDYVTEVFTAYTTYCPASTELTFNGVTYTVTKVSCKSDRLFGLP